METWKVTTSDPVQAVHELADVLKERGLDVHVGSRDRLLLRHANHRFLVSVKPAHGNDRLCRIILQNLVPFTCDEPIDAVHAFVNYLNAKYNAGSFHVLDQVCIFTTHFTFSQELDLNLLGQFVVWVGSFLDNVMAEEMQYVKPGRA